MADVTKTIAVQALWDGTKLKAGTEESETAIKGLEDQVSVSTESMESAFVELDSKADTTFATNLPNSADKGVTGLTTRASKFKGVGTDLGTELSSGIASGVSAPEQVANLGTSLTNLLALSASTGIGALGAVGAGIGVALISGIAGKIREQGEQISDSLNEAFRAIEVKARDTNQEIIDLYQANLEFKQTVADVGGGDESAGFERLSEFAEAFGTDIETVVQLINGQMTPGAKRLSNELGIINAQGRTWLELSDDAADYQGERAGLARELAALVDAENEKRKTTIDRLQVERNNARDLVDLNRQNANELERAAAAAERIGAALGNAVRESNLFDIALGG